MLMRVPADVVSFTHGGKVYEVPENRLVDLPPAAVAEMVAFGLVHVPLHEAPKPTNGKKK